MPTWQNNRNLCADRNELNERFPEKYKSDRNEPNVRFPEKYKRTMQKCRTPCSSWKSFWEDHLRHRHQRHHRFVYVFARATEVECECGQYEFEYRRLS